MAAAKQAQLAGLAKVALASLLGVVAWWALQNTAPGAQVVGAGEGLVQLLTEKVGAGVGRGGVGG